MRYALIASGRIGRSATLGAMLNSFAVAVCWAHDTGLAHTHYADKTFRDVFLIVGAALALTVALVLQGRIWRDPVAVASPALPPSVGGRMEE